MNSLFKSSGPKCSFWEWIDPEPVVMKIKIQKEVDDVKTELQNCMSTVEDLRKEVDVIRGKLYNVIIVLVIFFVFYLMKN